MWEDRHSHWTTVAAAGFSCVSIWFLFFAAADSRANPPSFSDLIDSNRHPDVATSLEQFLPNWPPDQHTPEGSGAVNAIRLAAFEEPVQDLDSTVELYSPTQSEPETQQSGFGEDIRLGSISDSRLLATLKPTPPKLVPFKKVLNADQIDPQFESSFRTDSKTVSESKSETQSDLEKPKPVESDDNNKSGLELDGSIESFIERIATEQITDAVHQLTWSLDDAINAALLFSHQARALRLARFESYQDIGIRLGKFDVNSYFRTNYIDSNTPIGNSFQSIGGIDRIRGEEFTTSFGFRKELLSGGQIEIGETNISRDDNSGILTPPNQARSVLLLRFSKELLRGSGKSIAANEVLVAQLNANSVSNVSVTRLTRLIQQISNSWWNIFSARGELLAAIEAVKISDSMLQDLIHRQEIDADPNLIGLARSASQQQKLFADIAYAKLSKAQFELIRLVNAPELLENRQRIEIFPIGVGMEYLEVTDAESRQNTAIHNRPEVKKLLEDIKRSQLLHHFSINQLLPRLQFSTGANFEGLSGNRDFSQAARNRFDSDATYQIAVNFEMPLGNREARFRKRKVELELSRLETQWKDTIEQVKKEVLDATQDLSVSQNKMSRQQEIFGSLLERMNYLSLRQNELPKETDIRSLQLSQLIEVQAAVARSKSAYVSSLAERGQALINMNRTTGILVQPTCVSLENPGQHNCVAVYHRFVEGERRYDQFADATTKGTWLISRQFPNHNRKQHQNHRSCGLACHEVERVQTHYHNTSHYSCEGACTIPGPSYEQGDDAAAMRQVEVVGDWASGIDHIPLPNTSD